MDNFALSKEAQKEYIEDFYLSEDENGSTYNIVYGDGRVFRGIEYNESNLDRIEAIQEAQMDTAINNKHKFKSKKMTAEAAAFTIAIGGPPLCGVVADAISQNMENSPSGLVLTIGIGVITVLGTIPAAVKLRKYDRLVDQIEKFEYRNDHKKQLESINDYVNALAGLPENVVELVRKSKRPFSIFNASEFALNDLKMIVDNIEREEKSGFQYRHTAKK